MTRAQQIQILLWKTESNAFNVYSGLIKDTSADVAHILRICIAISIPERVADPCLGQRRALNPSDLDFY